MQVLVLKSSYVLIGWINVLAELTESRRVVPASQANSDIKHFLSATLKECVVEDGFSLDDQHDLISLRIQLILTDELLCTTPFDEQTMEHMRALVGAYLALLTENYEHSINQTHRPTPLSFFVMTSKRLLNDVSILKEEKEERARQNPRRDSADNDSDSKIGGNSKHTRNKRRDTTASARLSYSSTSTSSSAESFLTFPGPTSSIDTIHGSDTNALASQSSVDYLIDENITAKSTKTVQEASQNEVILENEEESHGPQPYYARRISLLESDQSTVNTSFESELTPANSNNASFNSSSSSSNSSKGNSAWSGKGVVINDTTIRRSKRIKITSNI